MGSTRFFKVAKARFKEGPAVVKVFVIHDPSLPLKAYKDQLEGEIMSFYGLHTPQNSTPTWWGTGFSLTAALLFLTIIPPSVHQMHTNVLLCHLFLVLEYLRSITWKTNPTTF
jgi:hypothetical protein